MDITMVTIAEGKKGFSRLVNEAAEKDEDIVITKRGKPMAVIVPYKEYLHSKKVEAYNKIIESRAAFVRAGVSADDVYKESKKQLENRG